MSSYKFTRKRQVWYLFMFLYTLFVTIEVPLHIVYQIPFNAHLKGLSFLMILIFGIDIFVQGKAAQKNAGKEGGLSFSEFININNMWLKRDVLAFIPCEFIYFIFTPAAYFSPLVFSILRITHLIKLTKFNYYVNKFQNHLDINPSIFRLLRFILIVGLFAHWISCGWMILTDTYQNYSDYINSIYWCITTLTTIGYGDITPKTDIQKIYTMLVMIVGAGTFGYVIGNITSVLASLDIAKTHFTEKLEKINTFMKNYNIPKDTSRRVNEYYHYLWETSRGYDNHEILHDVPKTLRMEIQMHLNQAIIHKVPMFKNASGKLLKEIVMHLNPEVYIPGDIVFYFGDLGHSMYFVNRGSVEVVSEDLKTVYTTLSEGSFFGEMALLLEQPRNATILAIDYCNLYSIEKKIFTKIISHYPEFEKEITQMAKERGNSSK